MTDLISKMKSENRFMDAYIVAKNILSRNIGNVCAFNEFIDIALENASIDMDFDERKQCVTDANVALVMFAETVDIDEDAISLIKRTRARVNEATQKILSDEQAYSDRIKHKIQDENTNYLNHLSEIYNKIKSAKTQKDFDALLESVADTEAKLNKDAFSVAQEKTYEKLTKEYSQLIGKQMEIINKNELLAYNKRAVACFNEVFTAFKKEPSRYKEENSLKALMTTKFFSFDTGKLFNESLVFYNHVYSLVFQEATDALKYKLTEWALNTMKLEK